MASKPPQKAKSVKAGKSTKMARPLPSVKSATSTMRDAADELDADILLINAPMGNGIEAKIRSVVEARTKRRENLVVVLVTAGGLADAAYRSSVYLQTQYQRVTYCISGWCKSAGTLMAIGGHELIFACTGEMGPLDVQVIVKDELAESRDSGLIVDAAFDALTDTAYKVFQKFLTGIVIDSQGVITTKMAADVSSSMTIGLMSPVFEKIDPLRMGTDQRLMSIGREYAIRLNKKAQNLKGADALNMLLNGYPSHGFVIDLGEAENLFVNVKSLEGHLEKGVEHLNKLALVPAPKPIVAYLEGNENGKSEKAESSKGEPAADPKRTG